MPSRQEGRRKVTPLVVVVRVMWKRTVGACLMVFSTLMRTRIFLRMRIDKDDDYADSDDS